MSSHSEQMTRFDRLVLAMIGVNTLVLIASLTDVAHREMWERADDAILLFFAFEVGLRLHRINWNPRVLMTRFWDVIDTVTIVVSLSPMVMELADHSGVAQLSGAALLRTLSGPARMARMLHFTRHASHLRMFRFVVRWGTRPRPVFELVAHHGRVKPLCFFCAQALRWRQTRLTKLGWAYGPCCKHRAALFQSSHEEVPA